MIKRLVRMLFSLAIKLFVLAKASIIVLSILLFIMSWDRPETKIATYLGCIMFTLLIYGVKWGEELYNWSHDMKWP